MSDNEKKNKKTLVGMGVPSEEEAKAAAAEAEAEAAEEAEEKLEAAAEGADESEAAESDADASDEEGEEEEDADEADDSDDAEDEEEASDDAEEDSEEDDDDADEEDEDEDDEPTRRPALYLAEYETPDELYKAACKVRDAGFENWDCHTPYPVHGLDDAMGLPPTKIGLISFGHAMIGLITAVLMIQYMNNWDYPIIVGGKPAGSFPSMVPIMFELTVLLTGFGTLFGLLHLARLPRHHHPIFESDRFERATDDKFFISVEVQDPKFDIEETRALLEGTDPSFIELVEEELV